MEKQEKDIKVVPCIKCGRDIAPDQVFCPLCLEDMASAPVAPGTPVLLPPAIPAAPIRRQPVRKARKPEDQVRSLRATVVWLSAILAAVMLVFTISTVILLRRLDQAQSAPRPGENYSTNEDLTRNP